MNTKLYLWKILIYLKKKKWTRQDCLTLWELNTEFWSIKETMLHRSFIFTKFNKVALF